MSRRLSGRISPSAQRGLPRPRVLSGADLTFFPGKILIPSTECAKLISRNQAESKRERERERMKGERERMRQLQKDLIAQGGDPRDDIGARNLITRPE